MISGIQGKSFINIKIILFFVFEYGSDRRYYRLYIQAKRDYGK